MPKYWREVIFHSYLNQKFLKSIEKTYYASGKTIGLRDPLNKVDKENIKQLRAITCNTRQDFIHSLDPIRYFPDLVILNLYQTKVNHLDAFENTPKVKQLDINNLPLVSLKPLLNLRDLETLCIAHSWQKLDGFEFIYDGCDLKHLIAFDCWENLNTLEGLERFKNLEYLKISRSNVASLLPVMDLPKLKYLVLHRTNVPESHVRKITQLNPSIQISLDVGDGGFPGFPDIVS